MYKKYNEEDWMTLQDFDANASFSFKPTAKGEYVLCISVKDSRGVIVKKYMKVSVTKPVNTSRMSESSISLGKSFVIQCSARDGAGGYQYQVYYKRSTSDRWSLRQDYSENTRVTLKPTAAMSYDFCVKAKDANGNIDKIYFSGSVTNSG